MWPVRDEIVLEAVHLPQPDSRMLSLPDLARRANAGKLGELGVGFFHRIPKALRGIEARVARRGRRSAR